MRKNGYVFIVCGAAGTGKTTVATYLQKHHHMHRVVTHTTRQPRPGERDGVDYYFENQQSMGRLHLLEQVTYDGAQYGSSYEGLVEGWRRGQADVIVLDTAGAATYRQQLGRQAVIVFLTVSHLATLARRMTQRGDRQAAILLRLHSKENHRDLMLPPKLVGSAHVIVNDQWSATKRQLDQLVEQIVPKSGPVC